MKDSNLASGAVTTITVRFTQHQLELIERLRQEGFGDTPEEVVVHVLQAAIEEAS